MKQRLRRLEARLPVVPEESPLADLWPLLTRLELARLADAFHYGWPIPPGELQRLVLNAFNRRAAGMSEADVEAQFGASERAVAWQFWQVTMRLGNRHSDSHRLPGYSRYGLLDLSLDDVHALTRLAAGASAIEELHAAADVIGRLWLDGTPLTVSRFADLVLRGICPPAPARVPAATMPTDGQ